MTSNFAPYSSTWSPTRLPSCPASRRPSTSRCSSPLACQRPWASVNEFRCGLSAGSPWTTRACTPASSQVATSASDALHPGNAGDSRGQLLADTAANVIDRAAAPLHDQIDLVPLVEIEIGPLEPLGHTDQRDELAQRQAESRKREQRTPAP